MPVKTCTFEGKPGYKWGERGQCYTFDPGDETSKQKARDKAIAQGAAIGFSEDDETFLLSCHEILLAEGGGIGSVQVLKVGEYDIPGHGKVNITPSVLRTLKDNFQANVRRVKLPFNYEHGRSKAHGSKAAGWFSAIDLRNDDSELWVNAEWTPNGEKEILEKEYRYTSAEIFFKYKDNESGKVFDWVLEGAALTNKPIIKGMQAIAASEIKEPKEPKGKSEMKITEIKVELAENHGIDLAELQKKAKAFDAAEADKVKLSEENAALKADKTKLEGEKEGLKEKVDLAEKEKADMKFGELVKKGMDEGKLTKVMSEGTFKTMFEKNGADFCEAYLSEAPKVVDTGDSTGSDKGGDKETKTASVQLCELAEKKAKEDKISISEAQSVVLSENPKLAEAYEKEFPAE